MFCNEIDRYAAAWLRNLYPEATVDERSILDLSQLLLFVPGPLRNVMNGAHGHWSKHARWAKSWRERTAERVRVERLLHPWRWDGTPFAEPRLPKRVRFLLQTARAWDDDALASAAKPIRDGLVDACVIHADGPGARHRFEYAQRVDRTHRGVLIVVTPLLPAEVVGEL